MVRGGSGAEGDRSQDRWREQSQAEREGALVEFCEEEDVAVGCRCQIAEAGEEELAWHKRIKWMLRLPDIRR